MSILKVDFYALLFFEKYSFRIVYYLVILFADILMYVLQTVFFTQTILFLSNDTISQLQSNVLSGFFMDLG